MPSMPTHRPTECIDTLEWRTSIDQPPELCKQPLLQRKTTQPRRSYATTSLLHIRATSNKRRSSTTGFIPSRPFDERQGLDGGSLALAVDLDGQACAGWREVAQRKTESDDLAE